MEDRLLALESRLEALSRSNRRLRQALVALLAGIAALAAFGFAAQGQVVDELKVRHLLVVDAQGVPRVILGAPVDDKKYMGFDRNKPMYGLAVCDSKANEQIGLGVSDDGSVGLGLDCKPGIGNPANRERINLAVGPDGSAMIRMLDNNTFLKTIWATNVKGESALMFMKWGEKDGKPNPEGAMTYGLETKHRTVAEIFGGG